MIMTWVEAVDYLVGKGMKPSHKSTFSDQNRTYFAFGKNDVLVDHSATVTEVSSGKFYVSDFSS